MCCDFNRLLYVCGETGTLDVCTVLLTRDSFRRAVRASPALLARVLRGSFGKPHASAAVAFHPLLLCVVLLRKAVRLLMEQSEAS